MTLPAAATVGLLAQAVLALLFLLVWRRLAERWALLLALGYTAQAAMNALFLLGLHQSALDAPPATGPAFMAVIGLVLITAAVVEYVGLPRATARRLHALSLAAAALALAVGLAGWMSRAAGLAIMAGFVLGWALLFVRAAQREPRSGHAIVVVALLAYPATVAAGLQGLVAPELLGVAGVMPFTVLGATLLTTSLLRAHQRAVRAADEREQARAALAASHAGLEQEVAQRTASLRETIEALESFNRSVSHDLRGPLGGMAQVAQLAHGALARGDTAGAQHLLGAIERQAEASMRLVASLLALSRAGDAPLHRRPVDAGQIAREATAQTALSPSPVQVDPLPQVSADPDLLRQVFVNLIGNALKFSRGQANPQVRVGTRSGPGGPAIFVQDNGVGFDPEAAAGLFRPFQRLHGPAYDGTGVGLSIVKRIVERHGGRVWAEGRPGAGATFWFQLG